ncbi:MAG TPA: endo-1,4-beta-xylanase [Bryobacteraceae bacterium]|jgi:endo-1,4-beta-xylanase|nr:endo-1,4-beta-xylanase [Bryobacteraceae bacterium]
MNRRTLIKRIAALSAVNTKLPAFTTATLKEAAQQSGRILGVYVVAHDLQTTGPATDLIPREFSLIADGNDLKFSDRLRPSPDTFNFKLSDVVVNWAQQNRLLFRGHSFVWHRVLPKWFDGYVNKGNAEEVLKNHITTVMKHYAGRVYAWDVVNECLHDDGRPDMLRTKPWLDLIGPDYIEIAFRIASAADRKAKLVLNETNIEQDLPGQEERRKALLNLMKKLKHKNVPVTGLGVQGHLKANAPLATDSLRNLLSNVRDMGFEIMVTELDVDDTGIPPNQVDATIARTYAQFIQLVSPFTKIITFEQLVDDPNVAKKGAPHPRDLFATDGRKKPAYDHIAGALMSSPPPR